MEVCLVGCFNFNNYSLFKQVFESMSVSKVTLLADSCMLPFVDEYSKSHSLVIEKLGFDYRIENNLMLRDKWDDFKFAAKHDNFFIFCNPSELTPSTHNIIQKLWVDKKRCLVFNSTDASQENFNRYSQISPYKNRDIFTSSFPGYANQSW